MWIPSFDLVSIEWVLVVSKESLEVDVEWVMSGIVVLKGRDEEGMDEEIGARREESRTYQVGVVDKGGLGTHEIGIEEWKTDKGSKSSWD